MKKLTLIGLSVIAIAVCVILLWPHANATTQKARQQQIVIKFGPSHSLGTLIVAGTPCPQAGLSARLKQLVGQNKHAEAIICCLNVDDNDLNVVAAACKKAGMHVAYAETP